MTDQDLQLQHDKVSAEIAKLIAETSNLNTQNIHLAALTQKALNENKWYPAVIASGATLAIVAIVKIFL